MYNITGNSAAKGTSTTKLNKYTFAIWLQRYSRDQYI